MSEPETTPYDPVLTLVDALRELASEAARKEIAADKRPFRPSMRVSSRMSPKVDFEQAIRDYVRHLVATDPEIRATLTGAVSRASEGA